ncbi:MAG: ROK family protein [Bifidobacteriaceae bacterium]|jgi:glucokinase|nr:ROK family protein [Bifidobacteriaceae bacterium]
MRMREAVAVVEVGGSHAAAGLVDWSAWPPSVLEAPEVRLDPHWEAGPIIDALAAAACEVPVRGGEAWVFAVPDPFDYERGVSLMTEQTVGKFESLYGLDLRAALGPRLPRPAGRMVFLNDADAFGLGEAVVGAAAGFDRAVCIALGTGVGSAFVAGHRAQSSGPGVPPGGRLRHVEVGGRPLEDLVSSRAICRDFARTSGRSALSVARIAALARAGDRAARAVFERAMTHLATAVGPACVEFGAQILVVGGGMAASWDLVRDPLAAALAEVSPTLADMPIKRAAPGKTNALVGASIVGLDEGASIAAMKTSARPPR